MVMVIYPPFQKILNNSCYPQFWQHLIYIYIYEYYLSSRTVGWFQFEITMAHFYTYTCMNRCLISWHFNSYPKCLTFDTLYDAVSKKRVIKNHILLVFWNIARGSPVSGRSCLIGRHFFHLIPKIFPLMPSLIQLVKE